MAQRKQLLPGAPARNSKTGQPVMVLLELLGRRWALRIIWELRNEAKLNFRELQAQCAISSPTVLNTRLAELREAKIIEHTNGEGYRLTKEGLKLLQDMLPLASWANDWARRVGREDLVRSGDKKK